MTMKIRTKPYGEMEIAERQRLIFPRGIFGFEELREFALLDSAQPPFYWLQSLQRVEIAFVLIDPHFFRPDYTPDVDPAELQEIEVTGPGRHARLRHRDDPRGLLTHDGQPPGTPPDQQAHQRRAPVHQHESALGCAPHHPRGAGARATGSLMLILARRIGESIMVGDQVEISVVDIKGDQVKLGINAPSQVKVYRREVYSAIQEENRAAAAAAPRSLPAYRGSAGEKGREQPGRVQRGPQGRAPQGRPQGRAHGRSAGRAQGRQSRRAEAGPYGESTSPLKIWSKRSAISRNLSARKGSKCVARSARMVSTAL